MTGAAVALAGLFGLVFGSFVTVVTARVPLGTSISTPRSRCPTCEAPIGMLDNIPVVSYAVRRGRCHACGSPIGLRYPATELVTAALFAAVTDRAPTVWVAPALCALVAGLVALSIIDLEHRRLPTPVIATTAAVGLPLLAVASVATHDLGALGRTAAGAGVAFLLFGLIFVVAPGGMGFGDVRLAACCGAFLGWIGYRTLAVGLLLGFLSAGVVAIALVVAGKARRKTALPFGPFLALGTVVAVLAGAPIAHLWLG